jgi:cell division protein YceG involved in septum cleavage
MQIFNQLKQRSLVKAIISGLVIIIIVLVTMLPATNLNAQAMSSSSKAHSTVRYTITSVPAENGFYSISPKIPKDGKVLEGTVLTVKAKSASGYKLDAGYYTVKGGIWGTTSYESFSPKTKITVTKDMKIGATFIPRSLVDNVKVTRDVVKNNIVFLFIKNI